LSLAFAHLHSKSSFKYISFAFWLSQILPRVSILDESSKNARTFSQSSFVSDDLIKSTDSLNHLAISILCPAIPCHSNIFVSFSASALLTCIIFSASH
jgi:hypothetical protein